MSSLRSSRRRRSRRGSEGEEETSEESKSTSDLSESWSDTGSPGQLPVVGEDEAQEVEADYDTSSSFDSRR